MATSVRSSEEVLAAYRDVGTSSRFPELEAMAAGGSVARGTSDALSDVDLFVLVREDALERFLAEGATALASVVGPPVLFRGPIPIQGFGYSFTVQYADLVVCQFNVNTRSTLKPGPMTGDELVLFDRTGFYREYVESAYVPLDRDEAFRRAFTFFWLRAVCVRRDLERRQFWFAIRHLNDLRDQIFIVARLLAAATPRSLNLQLPSKNLENDLGRDAVRFAATLCSYEPDAVVNAFVFCLDVFRNQVRSFAGDDPHLWTRELFVMEQIADKIHPGQAPLSDSFSHRSDKLG